MIPSPNFKYDDTRLVVAIGMTYSVLAVVLWLVHAPLVIPVMVGVSLVVVAILLLHLHRERQDEAIHTANHTQALMALHTLLDLRRPLPPLTRWAASAELAAAVVDVILERRPQRVLELGSGASSVVIGYALEKAGGGVALSLDHDAAYATTTVERLRRHELSERVSVFHAPLVEQRFEEETYRWYDVSSVDLKAFAGPEGIDILLIDGPPEQTNPLARYPAGPALFQYLSESAVVILDDAARPDEQGSIRRWSQEHGFDVEMIDSARGTAILRRNAIRHSP